MKPSLNNDNCLFEGEEIATLLLNSTAEGIVSLDVDGNCTFCNTASLKLLEYENERDLLGKSLHELVHHTRMDGTSFQKKDCKAFLAFHNGKCMYAGDEIFWRKDGTRFCVEYHAYPIRKNGELIGAVVTFLDISERKRMETALSDSEKRYHTLAEVSPVGISHADAKGKFLSYYEAIVYRLRLSLQGRGWSSVRGRDLCAGDSEQIVP